MGNDPFAIVVPSVLLAVVVLYFAAPVIGGIIGLSIAAGRLPSKALKAIRERRNAPRKTDGLLTYWPVYVTFPFLLAGMGKAQMDLSDLIRNQPPVSQGGMSDREAWNLLAFCAWTQFVRGDEAAEEYLRVAAAYYDRRYQSAGEYPE